MSTPTLCALGRLVPKKGFDVLVEACGILERRGVDFEAVIVGETGEPAESGRVLETSGAALPGSPAAKRLYAQELRDRIAELGLERSVRLVGPLSQADLFDEYRTASLLCLPCRIVADGDRDGIPNVLAEAMACGLPVVSTPVSGIPELVDDGINGLLVPPDQPAAIAAAMCRVQADPGLAERLGGAARATIGERFDADDSASRLASLFQREVLA